MNHHVYVIDIKENILTLLNGKKNATFDHLMNFYHILMWSNFLWIVWNQHSRPLGLVHPKAISGQTEFPITKEYIQELFNSKTEMCCQPFVIAGFLLGVTI